MKRNPFLSLAFGLALISLLVACSFSLAQDVTPPPGNLPSLPQAQPTQPSIAGIFPAAPPNPAAGESIFAEKCAPCHGDTGLGDGPQASELPTSPAPIGEAEFARQAVPAEWFNVITNGNLQSLMPPFSGSLSPAQRWDLIAYVLSLAYSEQTLQQGEALYQSECAACHGETGAGDGPDVTDDRFPPLAFTDQEAMAQLSAQALFDTIKTRIDPDTGVYDGVTLSDSQLWALIAYLRTLSFGEGAPPPDLEAFGEASPTAEPGAGTPAATESTAEAGDHVVVSGEITNASGGEVPRDLVVTLIALDNFQPTFQLTTTVGSGDIYRFEDVETLEGRVFAVTVDYQGMTYGSDIAITEAGTTSYDLPVIIYDSTSDPSALRIERLHLFFEFPSPEIVRVIQLYLVANDGDKTVVPSADGQPVLTYPIPEEASNLIFEEQDTGERFVVTAEGFGDTMPIRPGTGNYQLLFAYDLPYSRSVSLTQLVDLPVAAVVVFYPDQGLKMESDLFVQSGTRELNGLPYVVHTSIDPVAAGGKVTLELSGRSPAAGSGIGLDVNNGLFIGLGALLVAAGVGVFWYRRRRPAAPDMGLPEEAALTPESLMDAIIALDARHESGDLPEEEYHLRRAELKSQLRDLLE